MKINSSGQILQSDKGKLTLNFQFSICFNHVTQCKLTGTRDQK
jgi:hypothetical protein